MRALQVSAFFLVSASPLHALDISKHDIVRRDVESAPQTADVAKVRTWENFLRFGDSAIGIHLSRGRSVTFRSGGRPYVRGLDEKTVRARWLERDRLVHVSWRTIPVGAGHYTYQGDVILSVVGDSAVELYREHLFVSGGTGIGNWSQTDCDMAYDRLKKELIVTMREEWSATSAERRTLCRKRAGRTDDGVEFFVTRLGIVQRARYVLSANRLGLQNVTLSLDLRDGEHDIRDVARFLLVNVYPRLANDVRRDPFDDREIAETVAMLRNVNPRLREGDMCRGLIAFPSGNRPYSRTTDYDGAFGLAR